MKQILKDQKLFQDFENQTSIKLALTDFGLKGKTWTEYEKTAMLVSLFM